MNLIRFWWIAARCWISGDSLDAAKWYAQAVVYGWRRE